MRQIFILFIFVFSIPNLIHGQIIEENAYFLTDFVNVGIDGERGREGTDPILTFNSRGGAGGQVGFTADPNETEWDPLEFNGDFFTPGAPESGFGIEINGLSYSNNYDIYQILTTTEIQYVEEENCKRIIWNGIADSVKIRVEYSIGQFDKFYATTVQLVNTKSTDLEDVYYYRNLDPDNNQSIGGTFTTENTIVSQPDSTCLKALVSATQELPHFSFIGLGAIGENWRVTYGGFSNRDGSDLWNGSTIGPSPFESEEGESNVADEAISISYKTDLNSGDSTEFTFFVILDEESLDLALSEFYTINYLTVEGDTGSEVFGECDSIFIDTVTVCKGSPVKLFIDGEFLESDYEWTWEPSVGLNTISGDTVIATPDSLVHYSVSSTYEGCLSLQSRTIVVDPFLVDGEVSSDVTIELGDTAVLEAFGGDTYEWWPEEGLSSTTSSSTSANPSITTEYFVAITKEADLNCTDTLSVLVTVVDFSELEEEQQEFNVLPNPCNDCDAILIQTNTFNESQLEIVDLLGKVVLPPTKFVNSYTINSGYLNTGVYLIVLKDTAGLVIGSQKLVVD